LIELTEILRSEPDSWRDSLYLSQRLGVSERTYFRYLSLVRERGFCPTCGRLVAGIDEDEDAG
jgi:hypothetical protein